MEECIVPWYYSGSIQNTTNIQKDKIPYLVKYIFIPFFSFSQQFRVLSFKYYIIHYLSNQICILCLRSPVINFTRDYNNFTCVVVNNKWKRRRNTKFFWRKKMSTAGQVIKCKAAVAWEANKPLCMSKYFLFI